MSRAAAHTWYIGRSLGRGGIEPKNEVQRICWPPLTTQLYSFYSNSADAADKHCGAYEVRRISKCTRGHEATPQKKIMNEMGSQQADIFGGNVPKGNARF